MQKMKLKITNKTLKNDNNKYISYSQYLKNNNCEIEKEGEHEIISINNNLYINIDSKNILEETSKNQLDLLNQRISEINGIKSNAEENEISKENLTKQITKKFLEKLYPKCHTSTFKISLLITREIRSTKKLSKDSVEEYINYFFTLRHDIKYSRALKLTTEVFRNIGYILCCIYEKFTQFSTKESGGIKECIKRILENNIDVLTDFFYYCAENGLDPIKAEKTKVWKNLQKKYEIPPELIFLINIFHRITILDVNFEFDGEELGEEDIKLFTITILNINYILPKLEHLNLNFIHNKLQFYLYKRYYKKIFNLLKEGKETIKKNQIKNHSLMYSIKWDFEHNFNLNEYRKNEISNEVLEVSKTIFDDYSILCFFQEKNFKAEINGKMRTFNSLVYNNKNISSSTDNLIKVSKKDKNEVVTKTSLFKQNFDDFELILEEVTSSLKSKKIQNNNKIEYVKILENNSGVFDIMLMTICGMTKIESVKKLNLLSNDFYNRDLINYMIKNYSVDVTSIDEEFHILDMLYNKTTNLDLLNIEINSMDIISFDKIIGFICKNQSLNSLKLSFFSADVSYFTITLLKVYEEIKKYEEIVRYVIKEGKNFTIDNFENKIVNDISAFFIDNLSLLFEIIKNKNNLEVLGLNFDFPNILINNMNYRIPIFKLILNIIILIDNKEQKNNNKIKKLTLLSPYTTFDSRTANNIDIIFKDIRIYKNCNVLKELNLQFQFYNIKHLKNIISPNLTILSIGDLDLFSFNKLVNYLTSYNFSTKSSLANLSIKLLNKIIYFNAELKNILKKLFSLKIKGLLELNLYTNIIIEKKISFSYLIKAMSNNWIPSYTIILNKNETTNKIVNENNYEIYYLISKSIENLIKEKERKDSNKNKIDVKADENEIFWILKYSFNCKYSSQSLNFFEIKNLIFTILKYLYLASIAKISYQIKPELESSDSE